MRTTKGLQTICTGCSRKILRSVLGEGGALEAEHRGWTAWPPRAYGSSSRPNPQSNLNALARTQTTTRLDARRQYSTAHYDDSTIYALSTAPGRAAIAIIRISGPACLSIYRALCPDKPDPKPRYATLRTLYEPFSSGTSTAANVLDAEALVLYFLPPNTVTGEDVLELHVHGGPAVVRAVLSSIPKCGAQATRITDRSLAKGINITNNNNNIRPAEPGEFTRRAFHNDRLSLPQIEALADTLSATTEQQRRLAVRSTNSHGNNPTQNLTTRYDTFRHTLLAARGELEALIDFAEDGDFESHSHSLFSSITFQIRSLLRTLKTYVTNANRGELLRSGIQLALLGAPNAGKSSLLNEVVGREAAIVSETAGTTRDVVEVSLDLGGYLVRLGDTAGLRRSGSSTDAGGRGGELVVGGVEKEGMRRAREWAEVSDVVVVVLSFERVDDVEGGKVVAIQFDPEVIATAAKLVRTKNNVTVVINKSDLLLLGRGDGKNSRDKDNKLEAAMNEAIQMTQHHMPGLDRSRIHFTSCRRHEDIFATNTSEEATFRASASASSSLSSPSFSAEDPRGIQTFLRSLISLFSSLTTALTGAEFSGDINLGNNSNNSSLYEADPSIWQESLGATERQRVLLEQCIAHLEDFLVEARTTLGPQLQHQQQDVPADSVGDNGFEPDVVLAAEHLRGAAGCLARITGRGEAGDVEEVLGVVFEKFCVGK